MCVSGFFIAWASSSTVITSYSIHYTKLYEPILDNAPTYLPYFEKDKEYIFENMHRLVIKDVAEAGGYGVLFGHKMSEEEISDLKNAISEDPRRFSYNFV